MATILRDWSFRTPLLYEAIVAATALLVGGESRLRRIAWENLDLSPNSQVLDLCCGPGGATRHLAQRFARITGLDTSQVGIERARQKVPAASFVQGFAEALPFADSNFDFVHTSLAMHEMNIVQLHSIFAEVYRVLEPGGIFVLIDFHTPSQPLLWPALALFLWTFETSTAWDLLKTDLRLLLGAVGFVEVEQRLLVGGSLQILQARRPYQ